jgi:uncharacterized protein YgbK (DUF1537 family)
MDNIVIIADDLTGAADTGVQFCPFYEDTTLVSYQQLDRISEPTLPAVARAIALYTNSRALPADTAQHRLVSVAQELAKKQPIRIYKKIDSCMRGNVGSEVETLLDTLGYEVSFIAPAFPEMGRTTRDDIHLVHGTPVDQTEIARDPLTPVKDSRLSKIIASQSRYPVGRVGADRLEGSQTELLQEIKRLIQGGVRHLVFDATCREHLDRIARQVYTLEPKVLPVGSAGLAGSLAALLPPRSGLAPSGQLAQPGGFNLLVCGTASEVTGHQVKNLLATCSYEQMVLKADMFTDPNLDTVFLNTLTLARTKVSQSHLVLSLESPQGDRAAARQAAGRQRDSAAIVRGVGRLVAGILTAGKPAVLFLTGGDTADAVLTAVKAEGIKIFGEILKGVVQGALIGGPLNGLSVVTKAGAFGREDTLVELHKILGSGVRG